MKRPLNIQDVNYLIETLEEDLTKSDPRNLARSRELIEVLKAYLPQKGKVGG